MQVLRSGTNTNTVPANAMLEFDRRLVPGETLEKARAEIHAILDTVKKEIGDEFQYVYQIIILWLTFRRFLAHSRPEYTELYSTEPVWVGNSSDPVAQELIGKAKQAVKSVFNVEPGVVCSPGSDDQVSGTPFSP